MPLLEGALGEGVHRAIRAKCVELGAEVIALGGVEDHVHLLVRLPAALAVADLVKHVKGVSSHLANFRLPGGGSFRWQGAYAAFSIDSHGLGQVSEYIDRQCEHHANASFIKAWELPISDAGARVQTASREDADSRRP